MTEGGPTREAIAARLEAAIRGQKISRRVLETLLLSVADEAYRAGIVAGAARERGSQATGIASIQRRVAAYYRVGPEVITAYGRSTRAVRARQVAMYLAAKLTPHSYTVIGRNFGYRDRTTITHGIKRVEMLCTQDGAFRAEVDALAADVPVRLAA